VVDFAGMEVIRRLWQKKLQFAVSIERLKFIDPADSVRNSQAGNMLCYGLTQE